MPIISGRVTTDVILVSALAFMSDYVVCRLLDDKLGLVKSWIFLLSESLCAWILLLWILSDVTQGSILFGAGFCLVIFGWAVVGMIIEAYGFILLFRYVICLHHICKFLNLTLTTVANVTLVSLFVYTHHWELMKSVGSHSGLSLLFMMKGDAHHSVSDTS